MEVTGRLARLRRAAALGALLLGTLPGCFAFTTKHEGEVLRRDLKQLESKVSAQGATIDERAKKLDESLDRATKLLARNSADLGADVQHMTEEQARLTGEVATLKRDNEALRQDLATMKAQFEQALAGYGTRLDALEKGGAGGRPVASPPGPPAAPDKSALFDGASRKLQAGHTEDARKDLRLFLQKFPADERADDAQFLLGKSYLDDKQYEKAIGELQRVIDSYPNGDMADDAFFQAGTAAAEMKWCTDARAYFGVLLQRYPRSPFAKQAKEKLDELKKQAKNKKVCQS